MRYTVRRVSDAAQQRDDLPRPVHQQPVIAVARLADDPSRGNNDDTNDQWSMPFGGLGVVIDTVEDRGMTVAIRRAIWVGD